SQPSANGAKPRSRASVTPGTPLRPLAERRPRRDAPAMARRANPPAGALDPRPMVASRPSAENATMSEVDTARPLAGYNPTEGFFDELFGADGSPRPHCVALAEALEALGADQLVAAGRRRDTIFLQQGITFDTTGEDGPTLERPFPLDLVPRILSASEWTHIKRGLAQRIRALNRFVDDVYHAREIVRAGIVPWRLVVSRSHFARAAHGIRPPGGVYCHVAGCDLVRDADGSWKVLEDNVRTPSGISYVLENRIAMTRLVPRLFQSYRVRAVDHYPQLLAAALRSVAPAAEGEATILSNVPTYLMSDPAQREDALARMDELVFKPTGESGGKGVFIGRSTPADALAGLAEVIRAQPDKWIAQDVVELSTVPTADEGGTLAPRHVDLRPFAVFGDDIRIVPGGLTRVALVEGSMIV